MDFVIYALIAIAMVGLWAVVVYNKLVKNRNLVEEGWSGIDVQLKRRANLIPNLLETVKGYMAHERGLIEDVTKLRIEALGAKPPSEKGRTEGLLGDALGKLFAVAESYPELKANQNFIELHNSLDEVEEQIQLARRYYNGAVRNMNIAVESFPSNLVARRFGFTQAEFFQLDDASERAVPEVSFR